MSETFPDLKTFQEKTLARLRKILKDPGKGDYSFTCGILLIYTQVS